MAGKVRQIIERTMTDDGGLLSAIAIGTDNAAALRAEHIWDWTGLPEPDQDEYIYGDHGIQIFLNRFGLMFNFRNRRFPAKAVYEARTVRHDKILQPLYQRDLSKETTFEICPGIKRRGASEAQLDGLKKALKETGINFYDRQAGYVGILPGEDESHAVVANRSAIKKKAKVIENPQSLCVQDRIFGELKARMEEAFSSASQQKVQEALQLCAGIASLPENDPDKILYASWTSRATLGPSKDKIITSATAYERKLDIT